jgi:hypothetical protein
VRERVQLKVAVVLRRLNTGSRGMYIVRSRYQATTVDLSCAVVI